MSYESNEISGNYASQVCDAIAQYCCRTKDSFAQRSLFGEVKVETHKGDFRVVELFAGVGGFRIGLERASARYKTVWSNQWEPSTKKQDAAIVYCRHFGADGFSGKDIATVATEDIPQHDLLVGGFPCQDYSVATTLKRSGGIEGKKGVLWWQIYRILSEKPEGERPRFLMFENVDRLLKSPASRRGRDFGIILASLADLGYVVEWRMINAADYGMPQRRRRTYIMAYRGTSCVGRQIANPLDWVLADGTMAKAFPLSIKEKTKVKETTIEGSLQEVSDSFSFEFENTGIIIGRRVTTVATVPCYDGPTLTLGDVIIPESAVPESFFIPDADLEKWRYQKGGKSEMRTTPEGYEYKYSEGAMAFPDSLDRPSRTIITGEGGASASRFKHVVLTPSGRYRRLTPVELERLNMFPDRHTEGVTDSRRAFLMGNALVTGIVERLGLVLLNEVDDLEKQQ